ncbi:HEPN domain-containing protein [Candidatus Hakubella thermalkaliphila]|uniref:HEPN domain-containing protein n=2 Tax=Candidatus Hakubella thermalkaliphila TaxID=2754717 RepID=A0A6V8P6C9_9ACTN|nr:HEPN domain-containing protein [Candidatus Hakubella thermalkaliphila]GFP28199.1 hypothetical protein HKBW3S33_01615 [Candidatus Hakubella thermalkaliphila]GFP41440.1 hypothetical protein HKBW3C_00565 [Candidatus Hakubella thermalkaliphila]
MRHPHQEEIEKEIQRSTKSIGAAERLFEEGFLEDAISRSYYAILYAAKAVLLFENIRVDSHEAVKRLFGLHLIKTSKIDSKYSRILREQQDDRYLADYDVAFCPESERVQKRIEDAKDFLEAMLKYLQERGIDFSESEGNVVHK